MTWLLLARFWWALPIGALIAGLWWQGLQSDKIRADRDRFQKSAAEYQVSAREWEASFRQAEKNRQAEQERAVQGINASEASCDARVKAARSSAVKIEHIVNKQPMECKPGEAIPRVLADPAELLGAIGVR